VLSEKYRRNVLSVIPFVIEMMNSVREKGTVLVIFEKTPMKCSVGDSLCN